ncbi:hypothetical protein [Caenimonas soli]|uniref:hypothetical protein n=1 Tax=Caenimonas soli TaxID=2735555 RepID=UPI001556654D|nr:hypothetical protein [Caenimonas soli]NPC57018.1 hypothetical protein [Caenimonas soli]
MNVQAFQLELTRMLLWYLGLSLVGFIATMWVLYIVVKSAIRDGINESGLVGNWRRTAAATAIQPDTFTNTRPQR